MKTTQRIFENREEAGKALAEQLVTKGFVNPLVLALPRGGITLAAAVAKALHVTPDVLLVRKLGAPFNHELALGAVVEGEKISVVWNKELIRVLKIDPSYLEAEQLRQIAELERRKALFRKGRSLPSIQGRTVIVVDDGVATGASVRAALQILRAQKPARLVLAVPVAPADLVPELEREVDEFICLLKPMDFVAVGQFYRDFRQVTDDEVVKVLQTF